MSEEPAYAVGQAVFLRTDTPEFEEEIVLFKGLEEMVQVCLKSRANLVLEKVIIYSMASDEPCALTLGFISATKGQRLGSLPVVES